MSSIREKIKDCLADLVFGRKNPTDTIKPDDAKKED